jgi:hypothetical protein
MENVNTYNYLGLKISSSGSFIAGVKELAQKAFRAYIEMKSSFMGMDISPRLYIKLFDSLVKPIALYGCEVWGSFGHKVLFTNKFYFNDMKSSTLKCVNKFLKYQSVLPTLAHDQN